MSSNAHCSLNHSQNQNPVSENKLHCGNIYKLSSNRIRDLMNHEMPYEAPVVSKKNIHLNSKLKLGYHKETPENFYKTTNNKFYNEKQNNQYISQHKQYAKKNNDNFLSFGVENDFRSVYKNNYNETQDKDSLNKFVNDSRLTQNKRKGENENFLSSYKADYKNKKRNYTSSDIVINKRHNQFMNNVKRYNNILAYDDSISSSSNLPDVSVWRNKTPFATSYNTEKIDHKKKFQNISNRLILGDFKNEYLTNNKENYKKHNYVVSNNMFAGKKTYQNDPRLNKYFDYDFTKNENYNQNNLY